MQPLVGSVDFALQLERREKGEGEEQEDLFNRFLIEHNIPFSVADNASKLFRRSRSK